jgi:fumarate hydratase class II
VNCGQSSNDVIPTAMHLAAATIMASQLLPAMSELEAELRRKWDEFWPVIKTGRTHLQDATPIRLGQEFLGYAGQLELGRQRCEVALQELCALAIGGTAVGTGIGMHPEFAVRMVEELRKLTARRRRPLVQCAVRVAGAADATCVSFLRVRNTHTHVHAQGLPLVETSNHFQAQATIDAVVQVCALCASVKAHARMWLTSFVA